MEYRTMADVKTKATVYRPKSQPKKVEKDLSADEAMDQADQCVSMQGTWQEWSRKSCVRLVKRSKKAGVNLDINDLMPKA